MRRDGRSSAATSPLRVLAALARLLPLTVPAAVLVMRALPREALLLAALALSLCAAAFTCAAQRAPSVQTAALALSLGAHHIAALSRVRDPARHLLAAALLAPAGAAAACITTTSATTSATAAAACRRGMMDRIGAAAVAPLVACAGGLVFAAARRARGVNERVAVCCAALCAAAVTAGAVRWPPARDRMVRPDTDAIAVAGLPVVAAFLGDRYETRVLAAFSGSALVAVMADARCRYARVDALL
jgi:hypothetical protein